MAADFSLLLGVLLVVSLGLLAQMVRVALPRFAALKRELAECPATRELRFTVRETVVSWNDGTVIALPVRPARLARPAQVLRPALLNEAA